MTELNLRLHWTLASIVLILDIIIVAATICVDKFDHHPAPEAGVLDTSLPIGWLGVLGSIFIFGNYGILIKTPSVAEANCDCMVFQCYYSVAVAFVSFVIWAIAGSSEGITFTTSSFGMGLLFGVLWITSQVFGYLAITEIGYAVGPAIWVGVTIVISFIWGVAAFNNEVKDWFGAIGAIAVLLLGVSLAAGSSIISDRQQQQAREQLMDGQQAAPSAPDAEQNADDSTAKQGESPPAKKGFLFGTLCAVALGLCNGSMMVSMNCFQSGCDVIGVQAYTGDVLAPLAFLPSLAAGILVAQPVLFSLYWGRSIANGVMPQFHFSKVALPGLLTGLFWGMGNFNSMYATVYLGQTIGFPLTQCCLMINGLWGILYYKEIVGRAAIGTFILSSAFLLGGATMDGTFG
jgi:glucose uptake protein GlcU